MAALDSPQSFATDMRLNASAFTVVFTDSIKIICDHQVEASITVIFVITATVIAMVLYGGFRMKR